MFIDLFLSGGILLNNSVAIQGNLTGYKTSQLDMVKTISPSLLQANKNPLELPTNSEEVKITNNYPITLQQAVELGQKNNNQLQVALLTVERSRYVLRQREAEAGLYPTVSLNAGVTYQKLAEGQLQQEQLRQQLSDARERDSNLSSNSEAATSTFNGRVQIIQNLKPETSQRKIAEEEIIVNELEVERLSEEIRLNIATDYYNLQQADEEARIALSSVENSQASLRDAVALERAGVGTRFDVLRSQVNLANAQQRLTQSIARQQTTRRQLAARLNLSQTTNISAADPVQIAELWQKSLEESILLAFQNRPELQQELARRKIAIEQTSTPDATYNSFINYNLLDRFNDQVAITDGYAAGLSINKTLFNGGVTRARVAQAKADIAIAETRFADQIDQVRLQVEQAFFNKQANLKNIQTADTALEQAKESLRLARLRFQAGVGTQTDVINAENELTQAEGNRLTAILDYNRALVSLKRAVAGNRVKST
ncbi:TolC family protein [Nostoc sp. UHCC 0870]|uniref:TolC family protein n=1 Tax=Nostoc sp. UHCC 0870 TaxID=2914041 RepID=UPI001EE02687|nr:TolC family protein [Nostoc sp. UHCC 0870]UKP00621.1 TolC family protein [Nostoc sp. UHCC 0870]